MNEWTVLWVPPALFALWQLVRLQNLRRTYPVAYRIHWIGRVLIIASALVLLTSWVWKDPRQEDIISGSAMTVIALVAFSHRRAEERRAEQERSTR